MSRAPVQRVVLWGLLIATLLAIAFTAVMAPRWSRPPIPAAPPILGQAPDFELVNRDGTTIAKRDLEGSVWVADFIFTRCGLSCPRMTEIMARLDAAPYLEFDFFRVSFSVDPEYDTPEVLQRYADRWQIRDDRWLFVTGTRDEMLRIVVDGFKLALDLDPPPETAAPEEPILHSTRFVLVDEGGSIRGYYNVVEAGELQRLMGDMRAVAGK